MTTIALADLVTPPTSADCATTQLALMALAAFPTTSWQVDSVPRVLINGDVVTLADLGTTIANLANGAFLTTAPTLSASTGRSPWVDLVAYNQYGKTRLNPDGVATQGTMVLADPASAGPFTISIAQLTAESNNAVQFGNLTGGVLPNGGTLSLTWQARSSGAAANLPASTTWTLITPLPGVTLTNTDPNWITQQGVDPETDASLVQRCEAAWPGLGGGANVAVYEAWAKEATTGVTRPLVLENTPTGGKVTIYLAGDSGGSTSAQVTAVQAYINQKRPLCVTVICAAATNNAVTIGGTVYVTAAYLSTAQAAFTTDLTAFQIGLALGSTVYNSAIVDLVQSVTGVRNVASLTLNGSGSDVTQASNQVAVFTNSLTWVAI
jgi:uncharacterized phage protein gp47/JayE